MQYRRLGSSGLQLSALSFGSWVTFGDRVGREAARDLLACAWDHGVNFFDNAESYAQGASETVMGQALRDLGLPRDGYCVSSKVFFGSAETPRPTQRGLSRKHVTDACHAALARLQVDYLDLFFCHRPDPETPIEETVWAMDALVRQGKVLYWGTSEWPATQIREAARVARQHHLHGPTMEQPQYNLLRRQRVELEYAPLYAELGLGTTTWSPLGSGLLTGKYNDGIPDDTRLGHAGNEELQRMVIGTAGDRKLERARRFTALAAELGEAPAPLAIAWCLRNPHVSTVITGASRVGQLQQNLTAIDLAQRYDETVWERLSAAAS